MARLIIASIRALPAAPLAAYCAAWLGRLVTRVLARQLQMPEAAVQDAGLYLCAYLETFERQLLQVVLSKLS